MESTTSADATRAALERLARVLGFDLFGVAPAAALDAELAEYQRRVADGHLRGMAWLEDRSIAFKPGELVEGAQSVIVLGMSYNQPDGPMPAGPSGRIAKYARGRDYHHTIRPKLRKLAAELEARAGRPVKSRLFVDSGPLAERAFARLAGIGWIGKNTLLLNKRAGSWLVLAALVTDVALPADSPVKTTCGGCRRCLDACPTGAFPEPYVLDATRCISYLTIEHRGSIDPDLRPQMGDWIFGCDICQDVCPVNRKAFLGSLPDFAPRPAAASPAPLLPLVDLDQAAFDEDYRGSAIRRAKRDGFVRNVAVALGNAGDPSAIGPLARSLKSDPSPLVRGHAAWALGQLGGDAAKEALAGANDADPSVMKEIEAARSRLSASEGA
jgi:epoxyqueuosine reductase